MNITDYQIPSECPAQWPDVLRAIFARQRELMAKYKEIEQLPSAPVSLHHAHGQRVIKDFAWRTVEELTESYEAWDKHGDRTIAETHALEELADAVHFLVELLIFAGVSEEACITKVDRYPETVPDRFSQTRWSVEVYWQVTYKLGVAMNFLRNKAWKRSQVPTDEGRFRASILVAFEALVRLWATLGCDQTVLFNFYFRKSEVNKFRQRSNY